MNVLGNQLEIAPFRAPRIIDTRAESPHQCLPIALVVEDEPLLRMLAVEIVEDAGLIALAAADANKAIEILEARQAAARPASRIALIEAQRRRPGAIGVDIGFNDGDARRIFAGTDFTLMPSRFEPCGLSQIYAQRFGSLPIGHQTSGLAETIDDGKTDFLFTQPSTESFLGGICRAFATFGAKDRMNSMRRRAMSKSFSWTISAGVCSDLYRKKVSAA